MIAAAQNESYDGVNGRGTGSDHDRMISVNEVDDGWGGGGGGGSSSGGSSSGGSSSGGSSSGGSSSGGSSSGGSSSGNSSSSSSSSGSRRSSGSSSSSQSSGQDTLLNDKEFKYNDIDYTKNDIFDVYICGNITNRSATEDQTAATEKAGLKNFLNMVFNFSSDKADELIGIVESGDTTNSQYYIDETTDENDSTNNSSSRSSSNTSNKPSLNTPILDHSGTLNNNLGNNSSGSSSSSHNSPVFESGLTNSSNRKLFYINTISLSDFIDTIKTLNKTYNTTYTAAGKGNYRFNITFEKDTDGSWKVNYSFKFTGNIVNASGVRQGQFSNVWTLGNIAFKRPYKFVGRTAKDNTLQQLFNFRNNRLRFNTINTEGSSVNITYADICDFIWFKSESYKTIKSIVLSYTVNGATSEDTLTPPKYLIHGEETSDDLHQMQITNIDENGGIEFVENKCNFTRTYNFDIEDNPVGGGRGNDILDNNYIDTPDNNYYDNAFDIILSKAKSSEEDSEYWYSESYGLKKTIQTFKFYVPGIISEHLSGAVIDIFITYGDNNGTTYFTTGAAISDTSAFKAIPNSSCTVDYLNNTYKLHVGYKVGNELTDDALITVFKLKSGQTDFNGNISVYYGNQVVYPSKSTAQSNYSILTTLPSGEPYKKSAICYTLKRNGDYLYVYINNIGPATVNPKNLEFKLHRFVTISLSDSGSSTSTDTNSVKNSQYIKQDEITLHTVDISVPQVSSGDTTVYIDNGFNNKTKHYTNITKLQNENGTYSYYGVRAIGFIEQDTTDSNKYNIKPFDKDFYKLGIDGLTYNVNAQIVKLQDHQEENIIYSFKNGEEYIVLNQDKQHIAVNDGSVTGNKLIPSFAQSYEYQVNDVEPTESGDYNFRFYTEYAKVGKVQASGDNYEYINVSYEYTYPIDPTKDSTYVKVTNSTTNALINEKLYVNNFTEYSENDTIDENNIYEKIEEYVKISTGTVSLDTFKQTVRENENSGYDTDKYYKYSSVTNKYIKYTYDEVKSITSVPLNIYVKYVYYLKTSENKDFGGVRYKKVTGYSDELININIDDILKDNKNYYQTNSYIPIRGFITDGSNNYYGYKLRPFEELSNNPSMEIKEGNPNKTSPQIYIKQGYKPITLTESEIDNYKVKNIKLYYLESKDDLIYFIPIANNLTIYDIDKSGNTIYAWKNDLQDGIISLTAILNALDNINGNISKEDILKDVNSPYRLKNFDINGKKIGYIASLDGKFEEITHQEAKGKIRETKYLFIKEDSYNISPSLTDKIYNSSSLGALKTYKITKDNLFVPIFSKLGPDDLNPNNPYLFRYNQSIEPYDEPKIDEFYIYQKVNNVFYPVIEDRYLNYSKNKSFEKPSDYNTWKNNVGRLLDNNYNKVPIYTEGASYVETHDIHMSQNIEYYKNIKEKTETGTWEGQPGDNDVINTELNNEDILDENNNIIKYRFKINALESALNIGGKRKIKYTKISFYNYGIQYYTLTSDPVFDLTSINDISTKSTYKDAVINGNSTYTDEIFYKTQFFYPDLSINDGVHLDTDGSYYTNILTFDGNSGKISKRLYLNNHIEYTTRYSYNIDIVSDIIIQPDNTDLSNLSIYDYDKYYIQYGDSVNPVTERLNSSTESPAYFLSNSAYTVFTKKVNTETFDYNGIGSYQWADYEYGGPGIIEFNDNIYGLIFNEPIMDEDNNNEPEQFDAQFISFEKGKDYFYNTGSSFLEESNYNCIKIPEFDLGDDQIVDSNLEPDAINSILETANNELYYNNYKDEDTQSLYYYNGIKFKPTKYLYEIVELSLFTFKNYSSDDSIIQYKDVLTDTITSTVPFTISNAEEVEFTGTYSFINPEYKDVILSDGTKSTIIARDGYWIKDYKKVQKPLTISSYNYYPKDTVSAINISYNFIPYSYVLTAEINHPEISYEFKVNNISEEVKYSYIINGFEYDYDHISNPIEITDNGYFGSIKLLDINDTYTDVKVSLYKKNAVIAKTSIDKVTLQSAYTSYAYYAYTQATPLTNEKIPVLYKTELMPAQNTKVKYWDSALNSYAVKTVITSYAYYAYNYSYEVVPFKVASYLYSGDLKVGNFDELGSYISQIGEAISGEMQKETESLDKMTNDLSNIFTTQTEQQKNIADENNAIITTYSSYINDSLHNIDENTNKALSYLSSTLYNQLSGLTDKQEAAINKLEEGVVNEITEQHNIIKDSLNDVKETIDQKMTSFEEKQHADLIGESSEEEKESKWEAVTYTPIIEPKSGLVSGYSYSSESGSDTITVGGSSLGQILQSTLGTVSTYTVTTNNEDGSYTVTTYEGFNGLANILANLSIANKIPNYNEFMVDMVPKLFASVDFENASDIEYDSEGNVKSRKKHNPTDIAKKCIMRADILWTEMKKKNIVQ